MVIGNFLKKSFFTAFKQYFIFIISPIIIGGVTLLLAFASDLFFSYFLKISDNYPWWPFISLPIGGIIITRLKKMGGSGIEGSGIQQVVASVEKADKLNFINKILNIRLAVVKFIAVVFGIGSGFVLGIEGSTVQIGACIANYFRKYMPNDDFYWRRQIIMAGGAAGIAAAYNAPMAAIVFVFEELASDYKRPYFKFRAMARIAFTILISDIIANFFFDYKSYYGQINLGYYIPFSYFPHIIILAITGGLIGGGISYLALNIFKYTHKHIWFKKHSYLFTALCGLLIAAIGLFSPIFGNGNHITIDILEKHREIDWFYMPLKTLGLLSTIATGLPGGIFTPSLSIGSGFGHYFTYFVDAKWHSEFIIFGMIAILSAITRAPLAACLIVLEMTGSKNLLFFGLFVSTTSSFTAGIFKTHFYHDLVDIAILHKDKNKKRPTS